MCGVIAVIGTSSVCVSRHPANLMNQPNAPLHPEKALTGLIPHITDRQLDGGSFPDGVLALTWDDGPDLHTLELARFLRTQHVNGTFFVVHRWTTHVSSDPGEGDAVLRTGYGEIPILHDLVRLGHRLGNHTLNHPILTRQPVQFAEQQLAQNQRDLDQFEGNELRLFRVPGGAWNSAVAAALNSDPTSFGMVGPIRWDIDQKDWEDSLECKSAHPATDCERVSPRQLLRLKATVTARRYLDAIEHTRHGIVLLHDRVGDVGSYYAFDVARALIPELNARRYVLAAPILAFSPLRERGLAPGQLLTRQVPQGEPFAPSCMAETSRARYGDINGDGVADRCVADGGGVSCELAKTSTQFGLQKRWASNYLSADMTLLAAAQFSASRRLPLQLADVDGDGLADCCLEAPDGIVCALSDGMSFTHFDRWSAGADFSESDAHAWLANPAYLETLRFADINGDGRADVCGRARDGVVCALSTGRSFTTATRWLVTGMTDSDGWLTRDPASLSLIDINGDDRADWCGTANGKVSCGLAP